MFGWHGRSEDYDIYHTGECTLYCTCVCVCVYVGMCVRMYACKLGAISNLHYFIIFLCVLSMESASEVEV